MLPDDDCEEDGGGGEEDCTDEGVDDNNDDGESDVKSDVKVDVNVEGSVGVVRDCAIMVTVLELKTANGATFISKESSITRNARLKLALILECSTEFMEW